MAADIERQLLQGAALDLARVAVAMVKKKSHENED